MRTMGNLFDMVVGRGDDCLLIWGFNLHFVQSAKFTWGAQGMSITNYWLNAIMHYKADIDLAVMHDNVNKKVKNKSYNIFLNLVYEKLKYFTYTFWYRLMSKTLKTSMWKPLITLSGIASYQIFSEALTFLNLFITKANEPKPGLSTPILYIRNRDVRIVINHSHLFLHQILFRFGGGLSIPVALIIIFREVNK